ncbi:sugar transferase [Phocaeicola massiliensis]|jgi:undecaprenyl phosphate N,N'-diacetylbacillosamine 1-phosphate transferase|uniref:sugar transferase n=1 Tax=Phocaeicola massiliensis TaxID=204516 RepID=UPI0022E796C2|nr:sugar transferase [Phocaeicola massiliensis]
MYAHFFKRIIDFSIALMVLLAISPVLLVITILLYVFNEGAGAFFLQERPGLHGKIFKIIKFKTMNERKDASGRLLPDVQRITKFGRFVRNTSIDELPQLFNVLKGDMALIGPRPLLVKYLPLYSKEQMRRHDVRPGISGWAQCHGRNNLSWTKKFELDVWYVDHISLKTDLVVIFTTIKKVLLKEDINSDGQNVNDENQQVTIPEFNGHN